MEDTTGPDSEAISARSATIRQLVAQERISERAREAMHDGIIYGQAVLPLENEAPLGATSDGVLTRETPTGHINISIGPTYRAYTVSGAAGSVPMSVPVGAWVESEPTARLPNWDALEAQYAESHPLEVSRIVPEQRILSLPVHGWNTGRITFARLHEAYAQCIREGMSAETARSFLRTRVHELENILTNLPPRVQEAAPHSILPEETMQYLRQLCGMTGRAFDSLDLQRFIGLQERGPINKMFFEIAEAPQGSIHGAQVTALTKFAESLKLSNRYKNDVRKLSTEIEREQTRMQDSIAKLVELRRISAYFDSQKGLPFAEMCKEVEATGQWKLQRVTVDAGEIAFSNVNDVVLKHKDEDQGMDITVNMGRYMAVIDFNRSRVRVHRFERNIQTSEYYHPHVTTDASVCWGNAAETITQSLQTFNIKKLLGTLHVLLHEYNDESPYRALVEFRDAGRYTCMGRIWVWAYWLNSEADDSSFDEMIDGNDEESDDEGNSAYKWRMQHYKDNATGKFYIKDNDYNYIELDNKWTCNDGEFPPESE